MRQRKLSDSFSGTIDRLELLHLIQVACLARLNLEIRVETAGQQGEILIYNGQVYDAATGPQKGEDAFFEMVRWSGGYIDAVPRTVEPVRSMKKGWVFLLTEAKRLMDSRDAAPPSAQGDDPPDTGYLATLRRLQLVDLVQLVCMTQKDYAITVRTDRGNGKIVAQGGQIRHAETTRYTGEQAFQEFILARRGGFAASEPLEESPQSIHASPENLLIDAMRALDERAGKGGAGGRGEPLAQIIQRMSMSEKLRLALIGSKEARSILIRDTDRMIQLAIIGNPKITESEVAAIAQSRHIDTEVLSRIAANREWVKHYSIRVSLVKNPKTPVAISVRFVQGLLMQDLKQLATSKAVPNVVSGAAHRQVSKARMGDG